LRNREHACLSGRGGGDALLIPFVCHSCGASFSLTTRALTLVDYELDCPECGSPAVQADLLFPLGQGPRLIEEPEAEAS